MTLIFDNRHALALRAANGNADAAAFLELVIDVLHFWDDLVDRDKQLTNKAISQCMWVALVVLPRNKFYSANFAELNPVLAMAIQNWLAANVIEEGSPGSADLHISFVIRSSYVDLIGMTALICGGFEHAQGVTLDARRLAHREGYVEYRRNLDLQHEAVAAVVEG